VFPPRSAFRQENLLAEVATLCSRCHRPVYLFLRGRISRWPPAECHPEGVLRPEGSRPP
jgi:hypothetical protein